MGTGTGKKHGAGAIGAVDLFSEHGEERWGGPVVENNIHRWDTAAGGTGFRFGKREDDDINATQTYQGTVGAAGGVVGGEAHGDGMGVPSVGGKNATRGVRD